MYVINLTSFADSSCCFLFLFEKEMIENEGRNESPTFVFDVHFVY
jgi:hypothetical protein